MKAVGKCTSSITRINDSTFYPYFSSKAKFMNASLRNYTLHLYIGNIRACLKLISASVDNPVYHIEIRKNDLIYLLPIHEVK